MNTSFIYLNEFMFCSYKLLDITSTSILQVRKKGSATFLTFKGDPESKFGRTIHFNESKIGVMGNGPLDLSVRRFKHLQSDIICTRKTYWAKLFLVCTIFQDQQLIYIHVSLNFGLNISNMTVSSKPLGNLSLYCNICFRNLNNKKITFTKSYEYVCTWQTLHKTRE